MIGTWFYHLNTQCFGGVLGRPALTTTQAKLALSKRVKEGKSQAAWEGTLKKVCFGQTFILNK